MKFSTKAFRNDHDAMLKIAGELLSLMQEDAVKENIDLVSEKLSDLSKKLNMHLIMEDNGLYPFLLDNGDEDTQKTAQEFMDEMSGITDFFNKYKEKWNSKAAIKDSVSGFIEETNKLFQALGDRIEKENTVLYPLAEAMEE